MQYLCKGRRKCLGSSPLSSKSPRERKKKYAARVVGAWEGDVRAADLLTVSLVFVGTLSKLELSWT